jgi:acetyltransferase-like isoleucine patch superfamily enzyme
MLKNLFNRIIHKIAMFAPGGGALRPFLHRMRGIRMGKNVWIAQLVYIDEIHPGDVSIGDNCTIGFRTTIFSHFYWGNRKQINRGKVIIEKDVFIGPHCVILPNVRIGEGAVIKAGTVVTRNVPPRTFWGTPQAEALGQVTVPLTAEHSYEEFIGGLRPIRRNCSSVKQHHPKKGEDLPDEGNRKISSQ